MSHGSTFSTANRASDSPETNLLARQQHDWQYPLAGRANCVPDRPAKPHYRAELKHDKSAPSGLVCDIIRHQPRGLRQVNMFGDIRDTLEIKIWPHYGVKYCTRDVNMILLQQFHFYSFFRWSIHILLLSGPSVGCLINLRTAGGRISAPPRGFS